MPIRGAFIVAITLLVASLSGCRQMNEQAKSTRQDVKDTAKRVKANIKKIQLHGEVDIEVMTQLTAVQTAYQKYMEIKNAPPKNWPDLEGTAPQAGTVQEARRQGAYVCFGATREQMAEEAQIMETLIAIKSPNDGSIWAVTFGGDIVPLTEEAYAALPRNE